MAQKSWHLNRRTLLKGTGVALALPYLGVMESAVVGVDHRIQYTTANCGPECTADIKRLEKHLVTVAVDSDVDPLAEEFSEESLKRIHATRCTVRAGADRLGRQHLFGDPNRAERRAKAVAEVRARVWRHVWGK